PEDDDTLIGPIINERQLARLQNLIAEARQAGARELIGGQPNGLVLPPHVFADVRNDMTVAREELFGPVAPLIRVHGEKDALYTANDTETGPVGVCLHARSASGRAIRAAHGMRHGAR